MRSELILAALLTSSGASATPIGPVPPPSLSLSHVDLSAPTPHVPPIPESGALDFKKQRHPGMLVLGLGAGVVSGWAATKTLDMRDVMTETDDIAELDDAFAKQKKYAWTSRGALVAAVGSTITYIVW